MKEAHYGSQRLLILISQCVRGFFCIVLFCFVSWKEVVVVVAAGGGGLHA